ncbi:MAG TPA: HprK-related kinase A [Steroidobacteraceae bacterium]
MSSEPTRVGSLSASQWQARLSGPGVGIQVGPFDIHLRTTIRSVQEPLQHLYRDHPLLEGDRVYSCHATLHEKWALRPRPHRRIRFMVDGVAPHEDMPHGQGLAVLEWGINLAIAMRFHGFLMLHAAVVEKNGRALLLPASPGHGKTTLCAALAHRGWRLFSDEFGLLRPGTIEVTPVPRPMPLKNESIDVIRRFAPHAELGPVIPGTRKGTIAHVKPPRDAVERAQQTASVAWIVFPRWSAGAQLSLEEIDKAEGFLQLATNAFNYELLGASAFETVREVVDRSRCFQLVYSDLNQAIEVLDALADADAG